MDFLSDSQPQNPNSSHRDLERLQTAWNHVKQKRQSEKKSVSSMKNAIHQEEQKNLQARLAMTEKQLSKARQNTALLMKKLSEAEQEVEIKDFELNQQRKNRQQKQYQIEQLKALLAKKNAQPKQQTFGLNKENLSNNTQNQHLKKSIEIKQKQIDRLCLKLKSLQMDKHNHDNQLHSLQQLNEQYRKRLEDTQSAMNQMYLGQQSKGAQLLEINEAKKKIQRLMILLRSTQQFKNFVDFSDDSKDVHHLKNIPKRLKTNGLIHRIPQKKKLCTCMDIKIDERLLWTPQASYRIMLQMKMKYDDLTEDCIEEILFQLNKIWLARQQVHTRRIKENYQSEIVKLKKKSEQRYDQMVARKQIQRLKKELSGAKNCCPSSLSHGNSKKCTHKGAALMQNLKSAGQYEDQIKIKIRQIKLLQQRIRLLQNQADSSDRALYLQGALWVIQKVLKELESNDQDMRDFESQFRNKIQDNVTTDQWVRSFKQFFQNLTQINNSLVERLFSMRQSTLRKVGIQKNSAIFTDLRH